MRNKYVYQDIKQWFDNHRFKLLSSEYKNNKQKIYYICDKGVQHSTTWNRIRRIGRCPCHQYTTRLTIEYIRNRFEERGYTLLTTKYINNHMKLDYICDKGHKHSISWINFKKGCGCTCNSTNTKLKMEYITGQFEDANCVLLSTEYINNYTKLDYLCPKGKKHSITWSHFNSGQRCSCYSNNISKQEREIHLFLSDASIDFVSNTKQILVNPLTNSHLELDLYFPNLNKAIEFNGEYWHSKPKAIKRDKIKANLCKEKNIDLLVIMYNDWIADEKICKQQIINFLK